MVLFTETGEITGLRGEENQDFCLEGCLAGIQVSGMCDS